MSASLTTLTRDAAETRALGAAVAGCLRAGDVVALTGELGAGKTCFVQGAAAALEVAERVTSPSFLLRRDYLSGRVPVIHLDVYRLELLQEVVELGYDDAFDGAHITFIEWGDAMSPLLPADHLEVDLRLADPTALDDERRTLVLRPHGDDWRRRLDGVAAALAPWLVAEAATPEGGTP